jgi:hypothetical protein
MPTSLQVDPDRLREFSELLEHDPRTRSRGIEESRAQLASFEIEPTVPPDIRQMLDTARNLSLYATFVHRFHPVARLVAYGALEAALREKLRRVHSLKTRPSRPSLKRLLDMALQERWITAGTFEGNVWAAYHRVKVRRTEAAIAGGGIVDGIAPAVAPEDIDRELAASDFARLWAHAARDLRNRHAHGELPVAYDSEGPLRMVVEAVNALCRP